MTVTIITTVISKIMQVGQNCFMSWMKHFNFHKVQNGKFLTWQPSDLFSSSVSSDSMFESDILRLDGLDLDLTSVFEPLAMLSWVSIRASWSSWISRRKKLKIWKLNLWPLKLRLNAMSWCLEAQCPQHCSCILPSTHFPTDASAQRLRLCPFSVHFGLNFSKMFDPWHRTHTWLGLVWALAKGKTRITE